MADNKDQSDLFSAREVAEIKRVTGGGEIGDGKVYSQNIAAQVTITQSDYESFSVVSVVFSPQTEFSLPNKRMVLNVWLLLSIRVTEGDVSNVQTFLLPMRYTCSSYKTIVLGRQEETILTINKETTISLYSSSLYYNYINL